MPIDSYYLQSQIDDLRRKLCCCEGDVGITTLSPPVTAPTTNGAKILVNLTTGVGYYWDGDSWEIAFTAVPNAAQIRTIEVDLSSDDIKGMFTSPVEVIAGIPGKVIVLNSIISKFTYGGVPYNGGGVVIMHDDAGAFELSTLIHSAANLQGTADVVTQSSTATVTVTTTERTVGGGIDIHNHTAPFTDGNGTIKLHITYQVITP